MQWRTACCLPSALLPQHNHPSAANIGSRGFQVLFLDTCVVPPLFLHAPGEVMKAEGVDGLSRAGARELRSSQSTQLLQSLVDDGAWRRHCERVTLDVFASGDKAAVVPRFFARHAEPEGRAWMPSLDPAGQCRGARRADNGIGSSCSFFLRGLYFLPRSRNSVLTGARCCHSAVRSVGPSMAHNHWGLAHTRPQTAGRLSHSPSLCYSAVRDGYERTRRGAVPGGLRGGLRSGGSGPALLLSRT